MARQARIKSELGIYLINLKSVEDVNFSKQEKIEFLNILKSNNALILSYTFFNNSFVFVLKEDDKQVDVVLRKSTIKFVKHFNKNHKRKGKIFAGRYTSFSAQTIDDVWKFISNTHAMRNIDNENITSYDNYFDDKFISSDYILNHFNTKNEFYETCTGLYITNDGIKLTDEEVENYIINNFKIQPASIVKMPETKLQNIITNVFKVTKASARQVSRITSLPLRALWNISKKIKNEKESCSNESVEKIENKKIKKASKLNLKNKAMKLERV